MTRGIQLWKQSSLAPLGGQILGLVAMVMDLSDPQLWGAKPRDPLKPTTVFGIGAEATLLSARGSVGQGHEIRPTPGRPRDLLIAPGLPTPSLCVCGGDASLLRLTSGLRMCNFSSPFPTGISSEDTFAYLFLFWNLPLGGPGLT